MCAEQLSETPRIFLARDKGPPIGVWLAETCSDSPLTFTGRCYTFHMPRQHFSRLLRSLQSKRRALSRGPSRPRGKGQLSPCRP